MPFFTICVMEPWNPDSPRIFFHHRNLSAVIFILENCFLHVSIFSHFSHHTYVVSCGSIIYVIDLSAYPMSHVCPFTLSSGRSSKAGFSIHEFSFLHFLFCCLPLAFLYLKILFFTWKHPLLEVDFSFAEMQCWNIPHLECNSKNTVFKFLAINLYCFGKLTLLLLWVKWIFSHVWWIFTLAGGSRDGCLFILKCCYGIVGNFINPSSHVF